MQLMLCALAFQLCSGDSFSDEQYLPVKGMAELTEQKGRVVTTCGARGVLHWIGTFESRVHQVFSIPQILHLHTSLQLLCSHLHKTSTDIALYGYSAVSNLHDTGTAVLLYLQEACAAVSMPDTMPVIHQAGPILAEES